MSLFGEWLCLRREMQEIPLSEYGWRVGSLGRGCSCLGRGHRVEGERPAGRGSSDPRVKSVKSKHCRPCKTNNWKWGPGQVGMESPQLARAPVPGPAPLPPIRLRLRRCPAAASLLIGERAGGAGGAGGGGLGAGAGPLVAAAVARDAASHGGGGRGYGGMRAALAWAAAWLLPLPPAMGAARYRDSRLLRPFVDLHSVLKR